MEADGLFVYGPFREGGRNHGWLKRTSFEGLTLAYTPGRLFHLPSAGFPALLPGEEPPEPPPGPGWVAGEFVGYEDEAALQEALEDLDSLEDVEGGLFQRQVLAVILDSGHRFGAWAHVFPAERLPVLEKEGIELPSGDWKPYLET